MEGSPSVSDVPQEMLSLAMYATAMQAVQFFEYKLAILCVWAEADFTPRGPPKNIERALKPLIRRITHAFQKASAAELRNRLVGKVDDRLIEEIGALIRWRDRLAHRYLREQFVLPPPIFGQAMFDELGTVLARFNQMNEQIDLAIEGVSMTKMPAGGEYDPNLEDLVKQLMYGELD